MAGRDSTTHAFVQRERSDDEAVKDGWIAKIRQQLEIDRAVIETSKRIVEESRNLRRRIHEARARRGRRDAGAETVPTG